MTVDGAYRSGDIWQSIVRWNAVGPDYFHVLGTRVLRGRDLSDADGPAAPNVAVVNQTFVDQFLAGGDPIGHCLTLLLGTLESHPCTIVGLAGDSKYTRVTEGPLPMVYFPYAQVPGVGTMQFELRTEGNPTALLPEVRRGVREFGPDVALLQPMTQQELFEDSFSGKRLVARLSLSSVWSRRCW